MLAADVRCMLKALPFIPFTIQSEDGMRYEIRHPELVYVTESTLIIGEPGHGPDLLPEHLGHILSVAHIERLIPHPALNS